MSPRSPGRVKEMHAVQLTQKYALATAQCTERDNALGIILQQWKSQGYASHVEAGYRLLDVLYEGLQRHYPIDFLRRWELLKFVQTQSPQSLPSKLSIDGVGVGSSMALAACRRFVDRVDTSAESGFHLTFVECDADRERPLALQLWTATHGALQRLGADGVLVLSVQELYQTNTQLLLWVLFQSFATVHIVQPAACSLTSNDKYVVAIGYRPEVYRTQFEKDVSLPLGDPMEMMELCPVSWIAYILNLQTQFTHFKETMQRQVEAVTRLLIRSYPRWTYAQSREFTRRCLADPNAKLYCQRYLETLQLSSNCNASEVSSTHCAL